MSSSDPTRETARQTTAAPAAPTAPTAPTRRGSTRPESTSEVVARQKEQFGGVKVGSAFFGWLTATGMAVLLTALVAAAGAAVGLSQTSGTADLQATASANAGALSVGGAIAVLVILLLAYYCGGYVAGRMARFNGLRQGVAVWVWAVVIALVVAGLSAAAGAQFDVLGQLNSFPRLPSGADLSTGAVVLLVLAVVVPLVGAVLGGLAGMGFHRRVDRATLGR